MNIEECRNYCLSKGFVTESFPFDEQTLVFKIDNKMFALSSLEKLPASINLKCNPERSIELRAKYNEITSGYHMSKKHWNTVQIDGNLTSSVIKELIDHSYELVVKGLSKKRQKELGFT
ncbi:MmcQ/YjbR family DNA-binding protein [Lutibacter citreus]|uniref:MmcQ/YjbR family DNA-binding protein n=1 Tax=Lutibacter citreus TaxID=2138210 RepID=UPI000DBE1DDB|nr:MmcQ/YjbR family DNA-binding protein [Lutibacter citreus]